MVPRIAKSGRSFKGAALYYLHDKGANTSNRVAFTETVNLPTGDANRAVAHMIDTATHADQLKAAAGMKSGRKLQTPVYAYSLAWHPDQAPSMADQMAAAKETLKVLGIEDRQALIVGHNDAAHPHVHVIVNRVCPETGKAAVMSKDQIKLSKWAEDYERRHGQIFCDARVANNADREKGNWRKDQSPNRREYYELKKAKSDKLWREYRDLKAKASAPRKNQLKALYRQKETRTETRRLEVKALYKPLWRDTFKRQREELNALDGSILMRLGFALKQDKWKFVRVMEAVISPYDIRKAKEIEHTKEREAVRDTQIKAMREATREVNNSYQHNKTTLVESWKVEDRARLESFKDQSAEIWDKPRTNDEPPKARKSFAERTKDKTKAEDIRNANRSVRHRAKRERKRNRGRDDTGRSFDMD